MRIGEEAPRFVQHESFRREPPPDCTPEALEAQRRAFLAKGGVIQQLPTGASIAMHVTMPNAAQRKHREAAQRGNKNSGLTKKFKGSRDLIKGASHD